MRKAYVRFCEKYGVLIIATVAGSLVGFLIISLMLEGQRQKKMFRDCLDGNKVACRDCATDGFPTDREYCLSRVD